MSGQIGLPNFLQQVLESAAGKGKCTAQITEDCEAPTPPTDKPKDVVIIIPEFCKKALEAIPLSRPEDNRYAPQGTRKKVHPDPHRDRFLQGRHKDLLSFLEKRSFSKKQSCRNKKGSGRLSRKPRPATGVTLYTGGHFEITKEEDWQTFHTLLDELSPFYYLTCNEQASLQSFSFFTDFDYGRKVEPQEIFQDAFSTASVVAEHFPTSAPEHLRCFISISRKVVWKKNVAEPQHKTGVHLVFPGLAVNQEMAMQMANSLRVRLGHADPSKLGVVDLCPYKGDPDTGVASLRANGCHKTVPCGFCQGLEDLLGYNECSHCKNFGKVIENAEYTLVNTLSMDPESREFFLDEPGTLSSVAKAKNTSIVHLRPTGIDSLTPGFRIPNHFLQLDMQYLRDGGASGETKGGGRKRSRAGRPKTNLYHRENRQAARSRKHSVQLQMGRDYPGICRDLSSMVLQRFCGKDPNLALGNWVLYSRANASFEVESSVVCCTIVGQRARGCLIKWVRTHCRTLEEASHTSNGQYIKIDFFKGKIVFMCHNDECAKFIKDLYCRKKAGSARTPFKPALEKTLIHDLPDVPLTRRISQTLRRACLQELCVQRGIVGEGEHCPVKSVAGLVSYTERDIGQLLNIPII